MDYPLRPAGPSIWSAAPSALGLALGGPANPGDDLFPGERLGDAAALGHHLKHALLGGEPATALRAGAATPDRGTIVGGPAVDHPAVGGTAERTMHRLTPSPVQISPSLHTPPREHNL